jgi:Na+:H+ antiporter, NhaA family
MPFTAIREFLRLESASGLLLMAAAAIALAVANSPAAPLYDTLLHLRLTISLGDVGLSKPLHMWVNDGLMAVFFLLIGLEVKREILEGELRSPAQIVLPGCAALGGFAVPAAIYAWLNWHDPVTLAGWAIPAATDIAFALGVLSLLGTRVPVSLKLFLTTLAIFDDIAAIVVIALFYTADLSLLSLSLGLFGVFALVLLNRFGVTHIAPYVLIGIAIWVCVLKSGVHATLAGFVVALTIPSRRGDDTTASPARHLEHGLHPWVAYLILPLFAFANAGVSFAGTSIEQLTGSVTVGIAAGLFVGKQLGILLASALVIWPGFAKLPAGASWGALYGVALLGGIGFTMSLFIGSLAFEYVPGYDVPVRASVLGASLVSALAGYLVLRRSCRADAPTAAATR